MNRLSDFHSTKQVKIHGDALITLAAAEISGNSRGMPTPLRLAIAGCGSRGRTYAKLAAHFRDRYTIVAAADPNPKSLAVVVDAAGVSARCATFTSVDALLDARPDADVLVLATQDDMHFAPAMRALELGYDLLLEKPAACTLEETATLRAAAKSLDRKIVLCFVLRYTPFYRAAKDFIQSGRLGDVVSIQAIEGVEPYHQAHSFVRGHWSRSQDSSPMILAKSSHDMDILHWLAGSPVRAVSSFGRTGYFHAGNAPGGATARCTDNCPHAGTCFYDSHRYLTDKRGWLGMVLPDAATMDDASILDFLRTSPWGRCVWKCDNDVVDHQVVALDFTNGITATFTMTAFESGRELAIFGTRGVLRGGATGKRAGTPELWFRDHTGTTIEEIVLPEATEAGYAGHGGGDYGIMDSLDHIIAGELGADPLFDSTAESHFTAFAAELSRRDDGRRILLADLRE